MVQDLRALHEPQSCDESKLSTRQRPLWHLNCSILLAAKVLYHLSVKFLFHLSFLKQLEDFESSVLSKGAGTGKEMSVWRSKSACCSSLTLAAVLYRKGATLSNHAATA